MTLVTPAPEGAIMRSKVLCGVLGLALWSLLFTLYYLSYFSDEQKVHLKPRYAAPSLDAYSQSNKVRLLIPTLSERD